MEDTLSTTICCYLLKLVIAKSKTATSNIEFRNILFLVLCEVFFIRLGINEIINCVRSQTKTKQLQLHRLVNITKVDEKKHQVNKRY